MDILADQFSLECIQGELYAGGGNRLGKETGELSLVGGQQRRYHMLIDAKACVTSVIKLVI